MRHPDMSFFTLPIKFFYAISICIRKTLSISIFCNISPEDVISAPDIESVYEVPLNFEKDNLGQRILNKFNILI